MSLESNFRLPIDESSPLQPAITENGALGEVELLEDDELISEEELLEDDDAEYFAEELSLTKKPMDREVYSDEGSSYNYETHPKLEEHVREYFSMPLMKRFLNRVRRDENFLAKLLQKRLGKPAANVNEPTLVLDLGSGVGVESNALRQLLPYARILSIDISDSGTKKGKADFNLEQVQGDVNDPPFPDNTFLGIHCKDVFVHIGDKNKFFAHVSRILAPGGTLLIVTAEKVYEEINQYPWELAAIKKTAALHGLRLVARQSKAFDKDDWYIPTKEPFLRFFTRTIRHRRSCLLFEKTKVVQPAK